MTSPSTTRRTRTPDDAGHPPRPACAQDWQRLVIERGWVSGPAGDTVAGDTIFPTAARIQPDHLGGSTHANYPLDLADGSVVVRVPRAWASELHLRLLDEAQTLRVLETHGIDAPRSVHVSHVPPFHVTSMVDGTAVPAAAPAGPPDHLADDVVAMWVALFDIDPAQFYGQLPAGWPEGRDTQGVWHRLTALLSCRIDRWRRRYAVEFAEAGIPIDGLSALSAPGVSLTPRPLRLIHTDLGRANLLVTDTGPSGILDWEQALVGDPVHDIAAHLHKTRYAPGGRRRVMDLVRSKLPAPLTAGLDHDLTRWTRYEQAKSLVIGTVTAARLLRDATLDDDERQIVINAWLRNLEAASEFWPTRALTAEQAHDLLG